MKTGNYWTETDKTKVSIARSQPKQFDYPAYKNLAPKYSTLKLKDPDKYNAKYFEKLKVLSPQKVYENIVRWWGEDVILCCWEKAGEWCHRRAVAEWLEDSLDIVIPEVGFERSEIESYEELCLKEKPQKGLFE